MAPANNLSERPELTRGRCLVMLSLSRFPDFRRARQCSAQVNSNLSGTALSWQIPFMAMFASRAKKWHRRHSSRLSLGVLESNQADRIFSVAISYRLRPFRVTRFNKRR